MQRRRAKNEARNEGVRKNESMEWPRLFAI
jgi:hypothetical protein